MKKTALAIAALVYLTSGQASAGKQPIATSMAECAAIYDVIGDLGEKRGESSTRIDRFRSGAVAFRSSAVERLTQQGASKPLQQVNGIYAAKRRKWSDKWLTGKSLSALRTLKEDKEWIPYCRKMGKNFGVALE